MGQNHSTVAKHPGSSTGNQENQPPRRLGERFGVLPRNRAGTGAAPENVPPAEFVAVVASPPVAAQGSTSGSAPVLAAAPVGVATSVPVAPVSVSSVALPLPGTDNMNAPVAVAASGSNVSPLVAAEVKAPVPVVNFVNPTTLVPASDSVASVGPVVPLSASGIAPSAPVSGNVPASVFVGVPVVVPTPHGKFATASAASGRTSFLPAFAFGRLEPTDTTLSAAAAYGSKSISSSSSAFAAPSGMLSGAQVASAGEPISTSSVPASSGSASSVSLVSVAASSSISPPGVALSVAASGSSAPARPEFTTSAVVTVLSVAPEEEFLQVGPPGTPLAVLPAGEATPSPSRIQPSRRAKDVAPGSYRITPFRQRDRRGKRAAREGEEGEIATPPSTGGSFAKRKRDEIEEARPFKRRVSTRLIKKSISESQLKK